MKQLKGWWLRRVPMLLIGLLVLSASGYSSAQSTQTLIIGAIGPLTGAAAGWGSAMLGSLEIAAKEVNDAGGLKVGNVRYQVKIVAYDDKYLPNDAVTAVNRLVSQDGAKFMFGPFGTPGFLASRDIAREAGALQMIIAYTPAAVDPKYPMVFRHLPSPTEFSPPLLAWVQKQNPTIKTAVVMGPDDAAGRDVATVNVKALKALKINVIAEEYYQRTTQDFSPILTRVLAKKPDLVDLGGGAPGEAGLILKQLRELGYKGVVVKAGGPGIEVIRKIAGDKNADGFVYYAALNKDMRAYVDYKKKFEEKYGPMNELAPYFYDGGRLLFHAIEKAGSIDPKQVSATLETVKLEGKIVGPMYFTGRQVYGIQRQLVGPFYAGIWKGGKETTVELQAVSQ